MGIEFQYFCIISLMSVVSVVIFSLVFIFDINNVSSFPQLVFIIKNLFKELSFGLINFSVIFNFIVFCNFYYFILLCLDLLLCSFLKWKLR